MKILFANPPIYDNEKRFNRPIRFPSFSYASDVLHPPILLAYVTSFIRANGHEVKFLDAPALRLNLDSFLNDVKKFNPDYTVFETSTVSFKSDAKVVADIKKLTDCKTVFVGPHVSAMPKESLEQSNLDAVVMGEYEYPLLDLIQKGPNKNIQGIAYRKNNNGNSEIIVNEKQIPPTNLDDMPFPARDLMPNSKYFDPILKNPFTYIVSGRGCPFRCTFCNWPQVLWGHEYRTRSSQNVVKEIQDIENNYDFKSFLFNDDTFTVDKPHAMSVSEEMIKQKTNIDWACYTRADMADEELLKTLRKAGCFLLKCGVESGNQEVLNLMKKGNKINKIKEGIKKMKDNGFHVHATFIFGMPGETEKSIQQTIDFSKELDPTTVQFSTAIPYPKTEFYQYLEDKGYLDNKNWEDSLPMQPTYQYPELSKDDLKTAVKKAYRSYYFRGKYVKIGVNGLLTEPFRFMSNFYSLLKLVYK